MTNLFTLTVREFELEQRVKEMEYKLQKYEYLEKQTGRVAPYGEMEITSLAPDFSIRLVPQAHAALSRTSLGWELRATSRGRPGEDAVLHWLDMMEESELGRIQTNDLPYYLGRVYERACRGMVSFLMKQRVQSSYQPQEDKS